LSQERIKFGETLAEEEGGKVRLYHRSREDRRDYTRGRGRKSEVLLEEEEVGKVRLQGGWWSSKERLNSI
jgi:hypothetical protein